MLRWSLYLDYIFLFNVKGVSLSAKLRFILLKYLIYIKNRIFGLPAVPVFATVLNQKFYYNDVYGIASLQRVYCEHYRLRDVVRNSSIIIDVGANIGQFNFFCSHYLKAQRIVSIEPLSDCYEVLKQNALRPEDCRNYAISHNAETVTIYVSKTSSQMSTTVKDANDTYAKKVVVRAIDLDVLLHDADIMKADLLKIDTEGNELDVLTSAVQCLKEVPVVLVEMSVIRSSTGSMFRTGAFLEDHGFQLYELQGINTLNPGTIECIFVRQDI